jgi:hypothetical protein
MTDGQHHLYWREELVGILMDVGWTGLPWAGGKIAVAQLSDELREVLEYIDRECKQARPRRAFKTGDSLWSTKNTGGSWAIQAATAVSLRR